MIPYGSLVVYRTPKGRSYVKRLEEGQDWHSNDGGLSAADVHAAHFGAVVMTSQGVPIRVQEATLYDRLKNAGEIVSETRRLPALFQNDAELAEFRERHGKATAQEGDISELEGACYLGMDAGSTTIKAVLIDRDAKILYSHYALNQGNRTFGRVHTYD